MPTLINMFMRNNHRAVNNKYKELKQQELTWEHFLTEVTMINNEEALWDSSKCKEVQEGNCCPAPGNEKSVLKPSTRSRRMLSGIVLRSFGKN